MRLALDEARAAAAAGEVPVGAVLVRDGVLLGAGRNRMRERRDPRRHAELECLDAAGAAGALAPESLAGATLYVTLEPCAMCCGALVLTRVPRVVVRGVGREGGDGGLAARPAAASAAQPPGRGARRRARRGVRRAPPRVLRASGGERRSPVTAHA